MKKAPATYCFTKLGCRKCKPTEYFNRNYTHSTIYEQKNKGLVLFVFH